MFKTMQEQIRKYSAEDIQKFHEIKGHPSLKLQSEVKAEYGKAELELFNKTLDFTYKILTTIGIVAGFGFTAITRVETMSLFIAGEAMLFLAILLGIYWIQRIYLNNLKSIQDTSLKHNRVFNARNTVYKKIFDRLQKDGTLSSIDLAELEKRDDEILNSFAVYPEYAKDPKEEMPLTYIIIFFIFGSLWILSSFLF